MAHATAVGLARRTAIVSDDRRPWRARLTPAQAVVLLALHDGPQAWEYSGRRAVTLASLQRRGLIEHVWAPPHFAWALTFRGTMAVDRLHGAAGSSRRPP